MTPSQARDIADETITYWRAHCFVRRNHTTARVTAEHSYIAVTGHFYPGGGWERVRAAMVDWLLDNEAGKCFSTKQGTA